VKLTGEATIFGEIDLTAWAQKTAAVPPGKAANGSATAPTIPPSPPRRSNKLLADRQQLKTQRPLAEIAEAAHAGPYWVSRGRARGQL
jgi:hypothetical protein